MGNRRLVFRGHQFITIGLAEARASMNNDGNALTDGALSGG